MVQYLFFERGFVSQKIQTWKSIENSCASPDRKLKAISVVQYFLLLSANSDKQSGVYLIKKYPKWFLLKTKPRIKKYFPIFSTYIFVQERTLSDCNTVLLTPCIHTSLLRKADTVLGTVHTTCAVLSTPFVAYTTREGLNITWLAYE